jgi:hypothetical protein
VFEAPKFWGNRHMKVVRCQPCSPAAFTFPVNIPGTHFCQRLSRLQWHHRESSPWHSCLKRTDSTNCAPECPQDT